ncbi:MAG: BatD family protein, partial [Cytophagia bacterium]|nr:BatD family protein [Cytophagia bacterium]
MRNFGAFLSVLALISCLSNTAFSQDITVELGKDEVGMNEFFTITVTVNNAAIKNYTDFPDIDGFTKRGTSSSSKTNIVNGQISSSQSITQRYMPLEEGTYTLEPFSLEVNGTEVSSQGKTVKVTPPVERRSNSRRYDPFDNLFGRSDRNNRNNSEPE